jgi:hypothetical protein
LVYFSPCWHVLSKKIWQPWHTPGRKIILSIFSPRHLDKKRTKAWRSKQWRGLSRSLKQEECVYTKRQNISETLDSKED